MGTAVLHTCMNSADERIWTFLNLSDSRAIAE